MIFKAYKMDGLGNDFLIIDNRKVKVDLNEKDIQKLSNRKNGIGFDQLIYIEKKNLDLEVKYFNSNGRFADACGNGNRCVAKFLMDETKKNTVRFYVGKKVHDAKLISEKIVSISMGKVNYNLEKIPVSNEVDTNPLKIKLKDFCEEGHLINIGNPHIIFLRDISDQDFENIGPQIENHKYFPNGINVTFVNLNNDNDIKIKTWERGAGKTLSCGTAACVTGHLLIKKKLANNPVKINFLLGSIEIKNNLEEIIMTGPVSDIKKINVKI